jgi:flagellar motility protein MotE (MotC chaperone)
MIAKLQSPLAAAGVGIALSVGAGVYVSSGAIVKLLEQAAAAEVAAKQPPPELKRKGWDFWTIEIDGLSSELKEEKDRLRQQSDVMNQRADRLTAEQAELAKIRADIESMRAEINRKVIEITADESKNLKSLSQTYSTLTPKGAVAIFKEMDDTTAVKILSLMKSDIVGPIFEEMAKTSGPDGFPLAKRAAALSEKLRLMKATKAGP